VVQAKKSQTVRLHFSLQEKFNFTTMCVGAAGFAGGGELVVLAVVLPAYGAVALLHSLNISINKSLFPGMLKTQLGSLPSRIDTLSKAINSPNSVSNNMLGSLAKLSMDEKKRELGRLYAKSAMLKLHQSDSKRSADPAQMNDYIQSIYSDIDEAIKIAVSFNLKIQSSESQSFDELRYRYFKLIIVKKFGNAQLVGEEIKVLFPMMEAKFSALESKAETLTAAKQKPLVLEEFDAGFVKISGEESFAKKRDQVVNSIINILPSFSGQTHDAVKQRESENRTYIKYVSSLASNDMAKFANSMCLFAMGEGNFVEATKYAHFAGRYSHFLATLETAADEAGIKKASESSVSYNEYVYTAILYLMNYSMCCYYSRDRAEALKSLTPVIENITDFLPSLEKLQKKLTKVVEKAKKTGATPITSPDEEPDDEQLEKVSNQIATLLSIKSLAYDYRAWCTKYLDESNVEQFNKDRAEALKINPKLADQVHLNLLPNDLVIHALTFLSGGELQKWSSCNKRFKEFGYRAMLRSGLYYDWRHGTGEEDPASKSSFVVSPAEVEVAMKHVHTIHSKNFNDKTVDFVIKMKQKHQQALQQAKPEQQEQVAKISKVVVYDKCSADFSKLAPFVNGDNRLAKLLVSRNCKIGEYRLITMANPSFRIEQVLVYDLPLHSRHFYRDELRRMRQLYQQVEPIAE